MADSKVLVLVLGLCLFVAYPELTEAKRLKPHTAQACEGQRLKLSCPEGNVIKVSDAGYGRRNASVCYYFEEEDANFQFCQSDSAFDLIRAFCDGRKNCGIKATNHYFGDPCPGQVKYAEAVYTCMPTARYEQYRKRNNERLTNEENINNVVS